MRYLSNQLVVLALLSFVAPQVGRTDDRATFPNGAQIIGEQNESGSGVLTFELNGAKTERHKIGPLSYVGPGLDPVDKNRWKSGPFMIFANLESYQDAGIFVLTQLGKWVKINPPVAYTNMYSHRAPGLYWSNPVVWKGQAWIALSQGYKESPLANRAGGTLLFSEGGDWIEVNQGLVELKDQALTVENEDLYLNGRKVAVPKTKRIKDREKFETRYSFSKTMRRPKPKLESHGRP